MSQTTKSGYPRASYALLILILIIFIMVSSGKCELRSMPLRTVSYLRFHFGYRASLRRIGFEHSPLFENQAPKKYRSCQYLGSINSERPRPREIQSAKTLIKC